MPPYKVFFYGALSFLLGVFLASYDVGWGILLAAGALLFCGFSSSRVFHRREFLYMGLLSLLMLPGAFYYGWYTARVFPEAMPFGTSVSAEGYVSSDPSIADGSQEAYITVTSPFEGTVLAKVRRFPELSYGTRVSLSGMIERPDPERYRDYLEKEGVYGIMRYPKIVVLGGTAGSGVKRALFSVKHEALAAFGRVLPAEPAAFLGGITLGARNEFSDTFKEAMSLSGTTHLVALSGYNISVLEWAVLGVLASFLPRRVAYLLLAAFIIGFVVMTGAEASVVRAAIMGTIVLFAAEVGRISEMRNILLFVALIMVLANPKVLAFDAGFQLSFLALVGIVYLKEAFISLLHLPRTKGFFSWRDNFLTTLAAQLMVLPVLVAEFGSFSPLSLLANVLILEFIPTTMAFGFALAAVSAVSYYAALAIGWVTHALLVFETGMIRFFGAVALPLWFDAGAVFFIVYYMLIFAFIALAAKRARLVPAPSRPMRTYA